MRNYPLIIIDRSRLANYPNDYIVCLDEKVGFVAKVTYFQTTEQWYLFVQTVEKTKNTNPLYIHPLKTGGIILSIENWLHQFEQNTTNINRAKTLLKKCFKKYTHAEIDRTPHSDFSIENQIKQQELTVQRAKANYEEFIKRSSKKEADYNIALAEEILQTLKNYKKGIIFIKQE
jgi:hypothetical protein